MVLSVKGSIKPHPINRVIWWSDCLNLIVIIPSAFFVTVTCSRSLVLKYKFWIWQISRRQVSMTHTTALIFDMYLATHNMRLVYMSVWCWPWSVDTVLRYPGRNYYNNWVSSNLTKRVTYLPMFVTMPSWIHTYDDKKCWILYFACVERQQTSFVWLIMAVYSQNYSNEYTLIYTNWKSIYITDVPLYPTLPVAVWWSVGQIL